MRKREMQARLTAFVQREGLTCLALAVILLSAFSVRTMPFVDGIFAGDTVIFCDTDPYYHMRRVEHLLTHDFQLIEFDYYLNYPEGGVSFWPPGFEMLLALCIRVFSGGATERAVIEPIVCWLPPLLGALTAIPVWAAARRLFGPVAGVVAALIVAFIPGHIVYSQVGKVDQHVAEGFTAMLLYAWFFRLMATQHDNHRRWMMPLAGGFFVWLAYVMWSGATLYLVPLFAAAGILLLLVPSTRFAVYVRESTLFSLSAFMWMLYPCLTSWWGRQWLFAHDALSLLQLVFLGIATLFFSGLWLLSGSWRGLQPAQLAAMPVRMRSLAVYMAGFLMLAGMVVASAPDASRALQEGMRLLLKKGDASYHIWLTTIAEYSPLWVVDNGRVVWGQIVGNLTRWVYAVPVMLVVLGWRVWRLPDAVVRMSSLTLAVLTVFLGLINMQQSRYSYVFGGMVAVCAAGLLALLYRWLAQHEDFIRVQLPEALRCQLVRLKECLPFTRWPRMTTALCMAVLSGMWLLHECRLVTESMFFIGGRSILSPAEYELLVWLRHNTPTPGNFARPQDKPAYGIMNIWDWGHFIEYVAQRPAAVNPYGMGIDKMVAFYLCPAETQANAQMEALQCRYVLTSDPLMMVDSLRKLSMQYPGETYRLLGWEPGRIRIPKEEFLQTMGVKLHLHDGAKPVIPDLDVEGLEHYRLVYETPEMSEITYSGGPVQVAKQKVFEYVRGARLRGRGKPHELVAVFLKRTSNIGREFLYQNLFVADAEGNFELVLPYSTAADEEPYLVRYGAQEREERLVVPEEAVANGLMVTL